MGDKNWSFVFCFSQLFSMVLMVLMHCGLQTLTWLARNGARALFFFSVQKLFCFSCYLHFLHVIVRLYHA